MKKEFSKNWIRSKQPRKQRKYRRNAPLHIKQKLMGTHLSAELRKKHGKRAVPIKKGDTVKIMRGQFKKKTGKVDLVSIKKDFVYVVGVEVLKKDGSKTNYPIKSCNLMITELNMDDKRRLKKAEGKKSKVPEAQGA